MDGAHVDWTSVWLFVLSCSLAAAGWWVRRVDRKLDALEADVASLRVNDAGEQARVVASREHLERIERMLVRIDEKLDGKADKATCTAIHGLAMRGPVAD